ncbi:YigZ family protein [Streptococcus didelphis]|uniref:YigZ family protein n=1 Tax=Streptococcus didelphis TaxID=102886 RepID=A0ABY9LID2_9STRE|nr:YigZ family protein [Streptococcus didelphis]WMB28594.1 YigZ family protein [Streptococcus didelphis]WMB29270.1 YigZ family protein [Streptococcus didelphis]
MKPYKTIQATVTFETIIKKSQFICKLYPIDSEEDGKKIIESIKKTHYKANHTCSAMIIGEQSEIKRSSDDGEPSGTAGIPILSVLEKQSLTNVLALVTRYFGGIKLGTGGLIRAYSSTTTQALERAQIVEVKEQAGLKVELTYSQYQNFSQFLEANHLKEEDTQYTELITSSFYFDPSQEELILTKLIDFYNGNISYYRIDPKIIALAL